jgi:GT2 family glycosyltransferase
MNYPAVSSIIVNRNTKSLVLGCLKSLVGDYSGGPHQIIVVDNGSTDGSVEAIRSSYPSITIIENGGNLGFSKAVNIGIKASSGDYVVLINSDIILIEGCLRKLVAHAEERKDAAIVSPKLLNADGSFQLSCKRLPTLWNTLCWALGFHAIAPRNKVFCSSEMTDMHPDEICEVQAVAGAFMVVAQKAIARVGLLDEAFFFYGEDTDWCGRFQKEGYKIIYYPVAQAYHLGGSSAALEKIWTTEQQQSAGLLYWRKHRSMLAVWAYLSITLAGHLIRLVGAYIALVAGVGNKISRQNAIRNRWKCIFVTGRIANHNRC